jgi:nuclear pore complex protein Nup107
MIQFNNDGSNDAPRSPTSLGNISFGSGSLIRATSKLQQAGGATDVLVEKSAESLDQIEEAVQTEFRELCQSKKGPDEDELYSIAKHRAAFWLLDELSFIASEVFAKMKKQLGKEESDQLISLSRTWRSRIQSVKDSSFRSSRKFDASVLDEIITEEPDIREIRKVQAELNTLNLFKHLERIRYPESTLLPLNSSIHMYLELKGDIGPYTPEADLWERFLLSDQAAREKRAVLGWLEACGQTSGESGNFRDIISELEKSAGIETGKWSHGFLHTRERLKSQKRKRQTDILQSSLLRNSENMEPLVTHLDPDVIGREERNLEKADAFYDRSLWLTCFAMMRSGLKWSEIQEWCEEQNEGWRVGSFGMLVGTQKSRTSLNGPEAGMLWRRMCLAQAQQAGIDPYQKAVYGLLAGDYNSVLPVCRSFDDILYAKYNALLLQSFEEYLRKEIQNPLPDTLQSSFPGLILPTDERTWNDEELAEQIFNLRLSNSTNEKDVNEAFKLLQASIIADDFPNLIFQVGGIISERANATSKSRLIPNELGDVYDKSYTCLVDDYDAIRTIIHIANISTSVGCEFSADHRRYLNHITIAYIDFLRLHRKIDLIPTYTTLLDDDTRDMTLGKVMVDITDRTEQTRLLHLINDNEVNIGKVILEGVWHAASLLGFLSETSMLLKRSTKFSSHFIEPVQMAKYWPGLRIRREFRLEDINFAQERLVHASEWFLAIPSMWQDTFEAVEKVTRWFLECAWFGPALAVAKKIPYKALIAQKIGQYLPEEVVKGINPHRPKNQGFDLFKDEHVGYQSLDEEGQFQIDMLRTQARPLKELQELCHAIEHLVFWRDFEDIVIKRLEKKGKDGV